MLIPQALRSAQMSNKVKKWKKGKIDTKDKYFIYMGTRPRQTNKNQIFKNGCVADNSHIFQIL